MTEHRNPSQAIDRETEGASAQSTSERSIGAVPAPVPARSVCQDASDPELGASTAEYGIVMLAAVGFAGLLVVILKSGEVKDLLMGIIRTALSTG